MSAIKWMLAILFGAVQLAVILSPFWWIIEYAPRSTVCADRREFTVGGEALGIGGSYCARWEQ